MMWLWFAAFLVLLLLIPAILSAFSRLQTPETGMVAGRLRECPDTPNCVSSEDRGGSSFAAPVIFHSPPALAWEKSEQVIREMGGRIVVNNGDYLHATFYSPLFRFIDDLELRMDSTAGTLHFRSASRIGYSDMGANRKRIEEFRQKITPQL